jgi:hypothetical protein
MEQQIKVAVVICAFGKYKKGDIIKDKLEIKEALKNHGRHVNAALIENSVEKS